MSSPEGTRDLVGIACDHGGFELKKRLVELLDEWGYTCEDLGTNGPEAVDYPDYAAKIVEGVKEGRFDKGILICGTGIGMSMAANRHRGVRAALCTSSYTARMARAHNDANVLCLGGRVTGPGAAEDILKTFLEAGFDGGRHSGRVAKFDQGGGT